jgi:hypothetical protein
MQDQRTWTPAEEKTGVSRRSTFCGSIPESNGGGQWMRSSARSTTQRRTDKALAGLGCSGSVVGMGTNPIPRRAGGLPLLAEAERYVSRAELARIMGVSVATVDRMVAEGMPSVTWGRRTRRFSPSAAIGWATDRQAA